MKKWTMLALVCALGLTTGIGGSTVSDLYGRWTGLHRM